MLASIHLYFLFSIILNMHYFSTCIYICIYQHNVITNNIPYSNIQKIKYIPILIWVELIIHVHIL